MSNTNRTEELKKVKVSKLKKILQDLIDQNKSTLSANDIKSNYNYKTFIEKKQYINAIIKLEAMSSIKTTNKEQKDENVVKNEKEKENKSLTLVCDNDHILQHMIPYQEIGGGFMCEFCYVHYAENCKSYHCRSCQYDLCEICYKLGLGKKKLMTDNETKNAPKIIDEIKCECGFKMKRFSIIQAYGKDKLNEMAVVCDKLLNNNKKCGRLAGGAEEFFRCQNPNAIEIHKVKDSFDYCLGCAGIISKEEASRREQLKSIYQTTEISQMYENIIINDENKKNDENELIAFATFVAHKTLNYAKGAEFYKKALSVINYKIELGNDTNDTNDSNDNNYDINKLNEQKFQVLNHCSRCLVETKEFKQAKKQFDAAIIHYKLCKDNPNINIKPDIYASLLCNYGRLYRKQKLFVDAGNKFLEAINIVINNNCYQATAFLCNSYALMLEQDLKDYDKASDYYLKAIENYEYYKNNLINKNDIDNSTMKAKMVNDTGFMSINKQSFLFQNNYIVFLGNVERLYQMEIRINLMIDRYKNYIQKYEENKLNNINEEDESNYINNKYTLSRLYMSYAQSIMRHPILKEKDIIKGENYLKDAIKLNVNHKHIYSTYSLYLQIIGLRIFDAANDKYIAFPLNKTDIINDFDISTHLELLVCGYIRHLKLNILIPIDIKKLCGYFIYEWKKKYSLKLKMEHIKKYYNLAIQAKVNIKYNPSDAFNIFNVPPKTINEQNKKIFTADKCLNQLKILQEKKLWYQCKILSQYFLILFPNKYELHLIYSTALFKYGGLLNFDLSLIHYQIGLILLQYIQNKNYEYQLLQYTHQNRYEQLKIAIKKIKDGQKEYELEIEKYNNIIINDDTDSKSDDILCDLYVNYATYLENELRDSLESIKYINLACKLSNNCDGLMICLFAIKLHELNGNKEIDFIKLRKKYGDHNDADNLFKKGLKILYEKVKIEKLEKDIKKNKTNETFSNCVFKYIDEMMRKSQNRDLLHIELMYDYLMNNYYNENDQETLVNWIDFQFIYLQFLIINYKDNKAYKILRIVESYALKSFNTEKNTQLRFLIVSKVAEGYSLINKNNEWKLLLNKCIESIDRSHESIHNILYYIGYLYETTLNDYKNAMIYYKDAMNEVEKNKNKIPGADQHHAIYSSVYANCLRIVNKDYKQCEYILKSAMKTVGNSQQGVVVQNMYIKYLKEMEYIKNNTNDQKSIDDNNNQQKQFGKHDNKRLREIFASGNWLKSTIMMNVENK